MSRFDNQFLPASIFIAALLATCTLGVSQAPHPSRLFLLFNPLRSKP